MSFISGASDWIGNAGSALGGHLSSAIEFTGGIAEDIAGIGTDILEFGREVSGQTSEEALATARRLAEEAVPGQAAQVPVWYWIGGGLIIGVLVGLIPNPFKK